MLIRLVVENFLSFNEETEFNMLTGDVRRHPHHVFKNHKVSIVKSAIIYGANGAGKSNLFLAFNLLKDIVAKKHIESRLEQDNKFKFSNDVNKPTKIEIDFFIKGKSYNYGLVINSNNIEQEWLYKLGFAEKDEVIFERACNKSGKIKIKYHTDFTNNPKTSMLLEILQEDFLDNNTSFIYAARDKKFKDITNTWDWINSSTEVVLPKGNSMESWSDFLQETVYGVIQEGAFTAFCNSVIKSFDTGIFELIVVKMSLDEYFGNGSIKEKERVIEELQTHSVVMLGDLPTRWSYAMMENGVAVVKKMVSNHKNEDGTIRQFELYEESEGTLRVLEFLSLFNDVIYTTKTIFIDEIEQSIHPSLLKAIIKTLQAQKHAKGQIIFTTHDSNLLDLDLFRQDEIWFAEKNKKGATELYSLSDYDIRPDLDIRKGYLSGRFGAIPFLANLKDINWALNDKKAEPQL